MRRWTRSAPLALLVGVCLVLAAGCGESLDDDQDEVSTEEGKEGWPETISYGLTPTDESEDLAARFTPFEEYMGACLDHPFEMFAGTDYTAMIEAMRTGNVHLGRFGPFSYTLAHDRAGADALAIAVVEEDEPTYKSLIITRSSTGIDELADLEGRSFAFVDPTSSSGHLFPRAMIIDEMGVDNNEIENWFSDVVFAGNHEASLVSVLNGDTDAGAMASNSSAIANVNGTWKVREDSEFADHPNAGEFTVVAESRDIPRTVEAVQEELPDSLKDAIMGCLEGVADEPSLATFREEVDVAAGFIPAKDSDYDMVRETADALNMSPKDLLSD